jgi:hypothetical protein
VVEVVVVVAMVASAYLGTWCPPNLKQHSQK